MIERSQIGRSFPPHTVAVELGRLRFFAKAVGETSPIYSDPQAAEAVGYDGVPIPPTFLFCLDMERPDPFENYKALGIDMNHVLHGGQAFTYHLPVVAGDLVTFSATVRDIYERKGGALEFVVIDTVVTNQHQNRVADLQSTIVVRAPEGQA